MKLCDGDILICKANRVIPNLIKLVTGSKWNHAAIYLEVKGVPGVIEAQMNGVNWKTLKAWEQDYGYKYIVYRKEYVSEDTLLRALNKAGHTSYDFFSFIFRQPWKIITRRWKNRGEEEESEEMICSEFVGFVYELPNWYKLTPDDLLKQLKKNIFFTEVKK